MLPFALLGFTVHDVKALGHTVFVTASSDSNVARCSNCGIASRSVHSHYTRQLRDLPVQGQIVELRVLARRFRCLNAECPKRIFTEPLGELAQRYAQRTGRLTDVLEALILRVSSTTAAALAERLSLPTSPRTLLRLVDRANPPVCSPRVVGVDDFALRRGRTYGTILCDMESGKPIDLLLDRKADPLARWLQDHPGVTVVVRDRASAYADGAQRGAPAAVQVADRFHLVRNVSDALREVLDQRVWPAPGAPDPAIEDPGDKPMPVPPPASTSVPSARQRALTEAAEERRRQRYEEIHRRHQQGEGIRQIARSMGLSRDTVAKYIRSQRVPTYAARRPRPSRLDPFRDYLWRRWQAGCHNARRLYEELVGQGYSGSTSEVRHFVSYWRSGKEGSGQSKKPAAPVQGPLWRDLRWTVLCPRERLTDAQTDELGKFLEVHPTLALAYDLVQRFRRMLREKRAGELNGWLEPFQRLARTMTEDLDAVREGIRFPWSTGPVEGHIHRLKLLKRLGYGRAQLPLLRARLVGG